MSNLVINANSIYDRVIRIGRQTENLVSEITFNLNMWIEEYGAGECVLNVKRNGDGSAYLVPMTIADGMTTWTITDTDTARKGRGEIQLKYTTGEKVKTSPIFTISCGESLIGEGEPPSGYEDWLTELNRMTAEVEAAKTSTSASAQTAQTAAGTAAEKATEAEQSATTASRFANNASASAESASTSAQASAQSAQAASVARTAAESAAISAQAEAEDAEAAKTAAQTAESNAQGFAQTASAKAAEAAESAVQAQASVTDAQAEVTRASAEADRASAEAEQAASRIYDFLPTDSASGPVASFTDGADNVPLKSLVVGIEPVQDLHGYSSPWPAGGGKNLWDEQWERGTISGSTGDDLSSTTKMRSVGFIPVSPNTEYRYICEVSSGIVFYYSLDKTFLSNYSIPGARVFTTPENCYFLRFTPTSTYGDTYNHDIAIVLNSTGVTTYSPYSNICPITGWTGTNITTCGKNVLKNTARAHTTNNVTYNVNADGSITANNTATGGNGRCDVININNPSKALLDVFSGKKLAGCPEGGAYNTYLVQFVINGAVVCRDYGNGVQIPDLSQYYGATNLYIDASVRTNYTAENLVFKPMISEDASYGAYEPYSGESLAVAFPTEAGTVYGGTLDVTSGALTVTKGFIQSYNGEALPPAWISDRDVYAEGVTPTTGAEVCYTLAEPITYQLTPTEVKSLLGQNNIRADTGDIAVEYRADIKAYINRKIAEAIAALS